MEVREARSVTNLDELKRLLGERGEEYVENGFGVTWLYYSDPHTAIESLDGTLQVTGLTPSQAVDATLGRDECHLIVRENLLGEVWIECDGCHWQMPLDAWPRTPMFNHCPNCGAKVVGQ